ncbi:MAG: TRAP transporter small permease [Leptothrix sp. (in: Bacteria)]|nr:TRAP transporter small permease [Leptothrix sp. (in: b-proteobacteria)]
MTLLDQLARLCAVLAGVLLTVIMLMTGASLIGRNTTGWTVAGDFELTGVAAGAAIALFMPWCQLQQGHVIVDFFTVRASRSTQHRLDRLGALLLAVVMALLAWRTALGGLSAWRSQAGTMMLGFPEWVVYLALVPPLMLSAVIALTQAVRGFGRHGGAA